MDSLASIPPSVLYLIYAAATFLLIRLAPFFITFRRLTELNFQHPRRNAQAQMPDYIAQVFQVPTQDLAALGFQPFCYYELEDIVGAWRRVAVMYHPTYYSFATLQVSALPDPANPATISFYTFFRTSTGADGVLSTLNGQEHGVVGKIPNTILQDKYVIETEEQWQAHLEQVKQLGIENLLPVNTPEVFLQKLQAQESNYIDSLVTSKALTRIRGSESYHLNWQVALKTAIKLVQGNTKAMQLLRKRLNQAKIKTKPQVEIPVEAEVEAYHYLQKFEQGKTRRSIKLGILGVTLALFILPLARFLEIEFLLVLIGVLFLHELGHFGAMRFLDYENTSIFFLPFFGAAASGRKDHATLTEKVMVLLAGPLPGLILGSWMAIASPYYTINAGWFSLSITLLVIINFLNLLPIFPLDGGRIVNLLLFARYPWADVGFKIATVGIVIGIWITTKDPFILLLGIVVGIGIPSSIRSAKIIARLRQQQLPTEPDTEQLLHQLFSAIKQAGYSKLPFTPKYNLVKGLLYLLREPPVHWTTRLSLLGVYTVCLLGGLFLTGFSIMTTWNLPGL